MYRLTRIALSILGATALTISTTIAATAENKAFVVPDPGLRVCIHQKIGPEPGKKIDFEADIPVSKIKPITNLLCEEPMKIVDLTGLEHAVNLESLSFNYLESKKFTLPKELTKLTTLSISNSKTEEIDIPKDIAKNIQILSFSQNENLKKIPFKDFTKLSSLMMVQSGLSAVPPELSAITTLKEVYLGENHITDFSSLPDGLTKGVLTKQVIQLSGEPGKAFSVPKVLKIDGTQITAATSSSCTYKPADNTAVCAKAGSHELKFTAKDGEVAYEVTFNAVIGGNTKPVSDVSRISGSDRYATSAEISKKFSPGNTVYIATGQNFPDALAGAAAAAETRSPLLLVKTNAIPDVVKTELSRLKPSQIKVLGGSGVISKSVFEELKSYSKNIHRLWGKNRYQTATAISKETFASDWQSVTITSGANFPDALSAVNVAFVSPGPILLSNGTSLDSDTLSEIDRMSIKKAYLVGGTSVLSESVANQLKGKGITVTRLSGPDRYATSLAAAKTGFPKSADKVYFATGKNFPDGLSAGPLVYKDSGPLLLTNGKCLPADTVSYVNSLNAKEIVIFGGTEAVSTQIEQLTKC